MTGLRDHPVPTDATDRLAVPQGTAMPGRDLADRVCRALEFALATLAEFGTSGHVDRRTPALSFGPEKVAAEAAMLAHAASGCGDDPRIAELVDRLSRELAPLARHRRILVDAALRPARACKYAVPHVLVTRLGVPDHEFDNWLASRCAAASMLEDDLPPSARAERRWILGTWGHSELAGAAADAAGTPERILAAPIDLVGGTREDAYALTHILFYESDFGHRTVTSLSRPADVLLAEVEGLLVRAIDRTDYDLAAELLAAWPQLDRDLSPTARLCLRVLTEVEDAVGLLPCGNVDLDHLDTLDGPAAGRYARATSYHTALVMGVLCAMLLRRSQATPDSMAAELDAASDPDARWTPDDVARRMLERVDTGRGHWLPVLQRRPPTAPHDATFLALLATVQALDARDMPRLHDTLAATAHLAQHPLQVQASDVVQAVVGAMAVHEAQVGMRPPEPSQIRPA